MSERTKGRVRAFVSWGSVLVVVAGTTVAGFIGTLLSAQSVSHGPRTAVTPPPGAPRVVGLGTPGPGAPRAWQTGVTVSPFSSANPCNGNLLTALQLVGWDPAGPPVAFSLYHNSQVASAGTESWAWGFDLGPGWSVSYGAHITGQPGDANVTVVEEIPPQAGQRLY